MDRAVLRIPSDFPNEFLKLHGISLKYFETGKPIDQFRSQRIPKIVVQNQRQCQVKKLGHCQMDTQMALKCITHTLIQPCSIPRHAALKRADYRIKILRELDRKSVV